MFVYYNLGVKLADSVQGLGISDTTAWRWAKADAMPGRHKVASGTILVEAPIEENPMAVALYARMSSYNQRPHRDRRLSRLAMSTERAVARQASAS